MPNKRGIPEIRKRLYELAEELDCQELADLADETYRAAPATRGKVKSPPLTPELAQEIRDYAAENPHLHQQEIANHFNVNHGRVSEALNNLV